MHVVVVSNALFRTDGIGNSALGIASSLLEAGHEVSLVYPEREYDQPRLKDWRALGANVVGVAHLSVRRNDIAETTQGFMKALRTLRALDADVIHVHQPSHGFLAGLASMGRKSRMAMHLRGAAPTQPGLAQRLGVRFADRVIPVSRVTGLSWEPFGATAEKSTVVYNGIDLAAFTPPSVDERARSKAALGIPSDASVIGFVGRFTEAKGVFVLEEVYRHLARERDDLWLVCVGSTEAQAEQHRRLKEALSEFPNVRLLDAVADTRPVMNSFDVGVVPSETEAFSRVVLELLATGVPVCGSAVGGTPEALGPRFAPALTDFGDTVKLATSITVVLDYPDQAELRNAHRERAEEFGLDESTRQNIEILESLPTGP